jgi:putative ABC transport system permease protein
VTRALEADPAVASVAFTEEVPGGEESAAIEIEGRASGDAGIDAQAGRIGVNLFDVLDVPMLAGRPLQASDTAAAATVIVNRAFAERAFGRENALGRRVRYQRSGDDPAQPGQWYEIVGVVSDLYENKFGSELVRPALYRAMAVPQAGGITLTMRVRGMAPAEFITRFRDVVTAVEPALRLSASRTFETLDRQQQIAVRLVAIVLGAVTASVLLLSAVGVYAMMSFTVSQRRREIGIRAALGADPSDLLRSLFSRALGQLAAGLAVGAVAALLIDALSGGDMLGGLAAVVLPAIAILLILAGTLATVGPARRGLRVDASEALKAE